MESEKCTIRIKIRPLVTVTCPLYQLGESRTKCLTVVVFYVWYAFLRVRQTESVTCIKDGDTDLQNLHCTFPISMTLLLTLPDSDFGVMKYSAYCTGLLVI